MEIETVLADTESEMIVPEYEEVKVTKTDDESDDVHSLLNDNRKGKSIITNKTQNAIKQQSVKNNHKFEDAQNLPPISFSLHHPFLHSDVEEFIFSPWYFLVLSIVNRSSSLPADVTSISSDISESLSSKLSVPSSVFLISSIVKYSSSSPFLSVNLSLVSPSIPNLHHRLCNLHKESPFFWIRGTKLELYQVRHEKNQHVYVKKNKDVSICFEVRGKATSALERQDIGIVASKAVDIDEPLARA